MAGNARLLAATLAAVLGAAVVSGSVGAQALPKDALLIEHWDGAAWTVAQAPGPPGGSELSAVTAVSPTNLWAVGSYVKTTGSQQAWFPLAEHYSAGAWSPVVLPTPNKEAQSGLVAVSGSSATDVWAVGSIGRTLIEHYDGKAWKLVPSLRTAGSELAGVAAVSPRDAWAVGSIGSNSGKSRSLIEHWNGSAWQRVASPDPKGPSDELSAISAWSARNIWAVGDYRFRGHTRTLTLHWNGIRWNVARIPSLPSWQSGLRGVTVMGERHVWAVGSAVRGGGHRPLTELWNVCHWSQLAPPTPSNDVLDLYAVSGLFPHEVWAVGSSGATPQTFAEHWDGNEWVVEPTVDPQIPAVLRGVTAISADDVWAVGSSTVP